MNEVSKVIDPFKVISQNTTFKEQYLHDDFLDLLRKIYQYDLFKPFLDFVVTICQEGRLKFRLDVKGVLDLNEGNCRTIEINDSKNSYKSQKQHLITIWKINADVVIHEISHMMEHEVAVNLTNEFLTALKADLRSSTNFTYALQNAVKDVLITQVGPYPSEQRNSELFARLFQLFAMSKEVVGKGKAYGYSVLDIYKAFPKSQQWIWDVFYSKLLPLIDPRVAESTQKYVIPLEQIVHYWANEAVSSFHVDKRDKKWSKSIKSIKVDN